MTPGDGVHPSSSPRCRSGVDVLSVGQPQQESIALDLKSTEGAETPRELVRHADVLVENFRVGVLDRLGFSVAELTALNPALVILSITGFGHDGPEAGRSGYDQIAQGEAGLMSITGSGPEDPQKVGTPIADILAGMYGAYGVLAALLERAGTGRGQVGAHLLAGGRRRRARLSGHQVHRGRGSRPRPRQPAPLDLPLRPVPLPRRGGADRGGQRRAMAAILRLHGPRPCARGYGDQR